MDISLSDFGGAPTVLVFAHDWTLGRESIADLDVICSALRRLGAGMVVLSGTGVWSYSPSGDERFEAHDDEIEAEIVRLASVYRIDFARDGSRLPTVLVLDGQERIVFAHPSSRPLRPTLACAMELATNERPEVVASSMVTGPLSRIIQGVSVAFLRERRAGAHSQPACAKLPVAHPDVPDADAAE